MDVRWSYVYNINPQTRNIKYLDQNAPDSELTKVIKYPTLMGVLCGVLWA